MKEFVQVNTIHFTDLSTIITVFIYPLSEIITICLPTIIGELSSAKSINYNHQVKSINQLTSAKSINYNHQVKSINQLTSAKSINYNQQVKSIKQLP